MDKILLRGLSNFTDIRFSLEFVELELETAPVRRTRWNLVKILDRFRFTMFLWSTLT